MEVLVDYNNLPRPVLNKGPKYVVDRALAALGPAHLADAGRVNVRLYDGWYQEDRLTPRAERVGAEVEGCFPAVHTIPGGKKLVVRVELAYAMRLDPRTDIWHTFRMRGSPRGLSCADPVNAGCSRSPCELRNTHLFFRGNKCPETSCGIEPRQILNRGEQKLVDGMMAADLFYSHQLRESRVAVVSSDDDMWPAIRTVLDLGIHVIHLHPLAGHRVPAYYPRGRSPRYTELDL